ncbi:putative metal ion binding protein [Hibiscus syriacus]|uniref:Metal ion binding protein n=1 Tax=Hibiscus syriacus TaxID=106335 RepID=A0A6A2ZNY1_HIBSY|nr:putative metal ion binding protein [Hibiscus syriacus]
MGSQNDPAVHSSIALLQERFRQLQRAKELRQEREVSRLDHLSKDLYTVKLACIIDVRYRNSDIVELKAEGSSLYLVMGL